MTRQVLLATAHCMMRQTTRERTRQLLTPGQRGDESAFFAPAFAVARIAELSKQEMPLEEAGRIGNAKPAHQNPKYEGSTPNL
jgi:hypothetical protein